ncbi:MAG: CoA-binding protein [Candidatus Rokuibacteriota bacterium]|nr:MAG: CoA-binding protein [Candidatus Rokubacteria bacterium]
MNAASPDLAPLFWPRAIAVIGASPDVEIIRGKLLQLMLMHGFAGDVFPVSRSNTEVQGLRAYPSIADVPEGVDFAVIVVPAALVSETLTACGERGVRAAVVITSGFAEERGEAGAKRQRELVEIAARYRMVVCGPNCEGIVNMLGPMVATFSPVLEHVGGPLLPEVAGARAIGVISQSGGVSYAYFNRGRPRQLRFSYVVSSGNEAVLEGLDYVDWMLRDGRTDLFLMYMEAVRDAAKFRRVAATAAAHGKPLLVAKVGRSDVAKRAAVSHTGSLAGADPVYDAMFRHYGIVRCDDLDEMVDLAAAFSFCALPKGRRVGVLTGSGGGAVWMADLLSAAGLEIPELDGETRAQIERHIPAYGASQNPVDVTAQAVRQVGYAKLIEIIARSPAIDALLVVGSLASEARLQRQAEELTRAVKTAGKPVLFCTYTLASPRSVSILAGAGIPAYTNMPNCARAFRVLAEYAAFQDRWGGQDFADQDEGAQERRVAARRSHVGAGLDVAERLLGPRRVLCEYEATPVLAAYDIARPAEELAHDPDGAVAAAARIGFPVALKVQSAQIPHKSDAGALALGLTSADAVRAAYARVAERARGAAPEAEIRGVLVQAMAPAGREMILGVTRDPHWGLMLMVGLGGIHVEVLRDVALSPVPMTEADARRLLRRLDAVAILDGVRGQRPADVAALVAVMARLSRLAAEHGERIAEIDLNPVIVHEVGRGVSVVDALIVTRDA